MWSKNRCFRAEAKILRSMATIWGAKPRLAQKGGQKLRFWLFFWAVLAHVAWAKMAGDHVSEWNDTEKISMVPAQG